MKTLLDICQMSKEELKKYLVKYTKSKGYSPINGDGYIYCAPKGNKPEVPVLLVAHMDTVHTEKIKTVTQIPYNNNGEIEIRTSSPEGIGGDDRCGIYAIMSLINDFNAHILFCEDEEIGCVGAKKFIKTELCTTVSKQIKYMIEIDRRGNNDAVYYSNDNKDFKEWIKTNTSFVEAQGSFTDIEYLMPAMQIAGVNFSSAYYNAHTKNEYIVESELKIIIDRIGDLLSLQIPKTFVYEKKRRTYDNYNYSSFMHKFDDEYWYKPSKSKKNKYVDLDTTIKLTVFSETYLNYYGIDILESEGNTKSECWANLFLEYPDLCFNDIDEFSWE